MTKTGGIRTEHASVGRHCQTLYSGMESKDNGKDNHASIKATQNSESIAVETLYFRGDDLDGTIVDLQVACSSRRRGRSEKTWSASDLVALLRTQTPTLDTSQETKGRQVECITRTCI
ncbi:hypothetical protein PoMZ_13437 [Pyricularia oryzae]|uniref:Uncharacterized protein n=1 Tax=Pyricularia oryzae TaxID=318829 RepID=A0A4P7NVC7_PYROR|nr:hypothetical protein PoMZ_13437 [Pyricularia oryzae]